MDRRGSKLVDPDSLLASATPAVRELALTFQRLARPGDIITPDTLPSPIFLRQAESVRRYWRVVVPGELLPNIVAIEQELISASGQ
jgi:hypothetical protein